MAKLTWDNDGERFYHLGVTKCALYPKTGSTYDKGVAWNGITSIQESPDGADANDMYADDIKYASLRATETFGGTIEAYTYPDEFAECDGTATITDAPMIHLGQQKRKSFGITYRTTKGDDSGNETYIQHIVYGCTASPSDRQYETVNDSPDAITFSWEFDTIPVNPGTLSGYTAKLEPVSTVQIDLSKFAAAKVTALENALYGTDTTDPYLPTIAQLYTMMK